jgi:hypothetical protein
MKHSLAELVQLADSENISMGRAALAEQVEQEKATERAVYEKMRHAWNVMKESVVSGMDPNTRSLSGLTGGQASKLKAQAESGNSVGGEVLGKATANALAVAELNAAMGRIVAAPTAGACGIIPGALTSAMERFELDEETLVDALFCAAGVVVMNLHELDLNRIRGWGRGKWLLTIAFFLGVIGIGGVPLLNGYASKTLLHEAIAAGIAEAGEGVAIAEGAYWILAGIEWIFLFSGGCTFAYMLKLFICVFVEKNRDPERQELFDRTSKGYMGAGGIIAVFGTSISFIVLGQKPVFNALASFMTGQENVLEEFSPLSFECLEGALISLGIGTLLYLILIRLYLMKKGEYVDRWPSWLDLENLFYRPLLTRWLPGFFGAILRIPAENRVSSVVCRGVVTCAAWICRMLSIGTDALIILIRRSVLREHVVADTADRIGLLEKRVDEVREAYQPIRGNFSFALMLSCIGMMVILGVIMFFNLRH